MAKPVDIEKRKRELTREERNICFERGTEPPFSGKYADFDKEGVFVCKVCGRSLFSSKTKFKSGTGWPSFYDVVEKGNVELHEDLSMGLRRMEVKCANCGAHLGHVFEDGPKPTGKRYCVNSLALEFTPKDE